MPRCHPCLIFIQFASNRFEYMNNSNIDCRTTVQMIRRWILYTERTFCIKLIKRGYGFIIIVIINEPWVMAWFTYSIPCHGRELSSTHQTILYLVFVLLLVTLSSCYFREAFVPHLTKPLFILHASSLPHYFHVETTFVSIK